MHTAQVGGTAVNPNVKAKTPKPQLSRVAVANPTVCSTAKKNRGKFFM
jgi:hypothetical protein